MKIKLSTPFKLNKKQQEAMETEIRRQIVERQFQFKEDYAENMDALVLYLLYNNYGFREKRLRKFFDSFTDLYKKLEEHYELPGDREWLAKKFLKEEAGIDIKEWRKNISLK